MIKKFPKKFEHTTWWPSPSLNRTSSKSEESKNGWSEGLEMELKEVIEVVKKKDIEDYKRLENLVLKINKGLTIARQLLTGVATVGFVLISSESPWMAAVRAGAMTMAVNGLEYGGNWGWWLR